MPSRVEVDGRVLFRDDATLAEEGLFGRGPITVISIFDPPTEELPPGGNRSMAYVKAHSSQEMAAHGATGGHTDTPGEGNTLICVTEDGDVPYDPKGTYSDAESAPILSCVAAPPHALPTHHVWQRFTVSRRLRAQHRIQCCILPRERDFGGLRSQSSGILVEGMWGEERGRVCGEGVEEVADQPDAANGD